MTLESMYNNNTSTRMDMKELIEQLEQKTTELFRDARSQLDKGNKTAGLRARRTSGNGTAIETVPENVVGNSQRKTERLTVRQYGIVADSFE